MSPTISTCVAGASGLSSLLCCLIVKAKAIVSVHRVTHSCRIRVAGPQSPRNVLPHPLPSQTPGAPASEAEEDVPPEMKNGNRFPLLSFRAGSLERVPPAPSPGTDAGSAANVLRKPMKGRAPARLSRGRAGHRGPESMSWARSRLSVARLQQIGVCSRFPRCPNFLRPKLLPSNNKSWHWKY